MLARKLYKKDTFGDAAMRMDLNRSNIKVYSEQQLIHTMVVLFRVNKTIDSVWNKEKSIPKWMSSFPLNSARLFVPSNVEINVAKGFKMSSERWTSISHNLIGQAWKFLSNKIYFNTIFFSKKVPVQYHRTAKLYAKVLMLRVAITTSKDFESRLGIMITFYSVLLISLCIFWTSTLPALIQRVEPIAVSGNRQLVREKDLMRWVMANIGCRARVTWYVARNWRHACVDSYTVRRAHTTVRFKL